MYRNSHSSYIVRHRPTNHSTRLAIKPRTETSANDFTEIFKANTSLVAWLMFLAIGGGLLTLYYARINYLPDIEWKSSIVYLAAATALGGGIGVLFALSLLLPGVIWAELLISDPLLGPVFCFNKGEIEPCVKTVIHWLLFPFAVVIVISHVALLSGPYGYIAVAFLLLILISAIMARTFRLLLNSGGNPPPFRQWKEVLQPRGNQQEHQSSRRVFMYWFWFAVSVLLSQISMFVVYRLSDTPKGWKFAVLTIICTAGVLISNLAVAVRFPVKAYQAVAVAFVITLLLLAAADRFSPLPVRLMAYFGLGGERKFTVLLKPEATGILSQFGLANNGSEAPKLSDVRLLSKVGDEYVFIKGDTTFTLPKSAVLSLQAPPPRQLQEATNNR